MVAQSASEATPVRIEDVTIVDAYNPRKTLHRDATDPAAVDRYAEMLEYTEPPPILVNQDMELLDGVHRLAAAKKAGRESIMARVAQTGNRTEALLHSTLPNLTHGKVLSGPERRRVALKLVAGGINTEEIATLFQCARATVYEWIAENARELTEKWYKSEDPDKMTRIEFATANDLSRAQVTQIVKKMERGKTNEELKNRCAIVARKRNVFFSRPSQTPPNLAHGEKCFLLRFEAGRFRHMPSLKNQYAKLSELGVRVRVVSSDSDFEDLVDEIKGGANVV